MYGIPDQTADSFMRTLEEIVSLKPEHLSVYGLILEEGTPLFENVASLHIPSEDEECDMYYAAVSFLAANGYSHYEISNYAKSGRECKHNLKYWLDEEYIGLGVSAHSYFRGQRYSNSSNILDYLSPKHMCNKVPCDGDGSFEYVMLHLRLAMGIPLMEYRDNFGRDFLAGKQDKIEELCRSGYVELREDRLSLTERGFYVSNAIIAELL